MNRTFKLSLKNPPEYRIYTQKRFEELMGIRYLPHLLFADWKVEQSVRKLCARALVKDKIGQLALWLGQFHGKEIENAAIPAITISWISERMGYGIFADRDFKKWEYIGEYTGILKRRPLIFPNLNDYCFMYPREWIATKLFTVDSEKCGNYTRYINHSDDPNCESVGVFQGGIFHLIFRTIKEVPMGTELTYDYGNVYWRYRDKI